MPRKKNQPKITSDNLQEIKASLLSDLDQFLIDENISQPSRYQEKQKALAELDKLIRQELSYGTILSTIKKVSQKSLEQTKSDPRDLGTSSDDDFLPLRSSHLLDLRSASSRENKAKNNLGEGYRSFKEKIKSSFKKQSLAKKEKSPDKPSSSLSKESLAPEVSAQKNKFVISLTALNWRGAFGKGLAFALIVLLLLAPIRGLVFFNRFQEDKLRIFDFGWQGFLDFQSGSILASENSYEMAQADFAKALLNFQQAQELLAEYDQQMLGVASYVPVVGPSFSLSQELLAVASSLSQAATILNEKAGSGANPTEYIDVIYQQVKRSLPHLEAANNKLKKTSLAALPDEARPYFEELKMYLPLALESFHTLEDVFSVLLGVLGHTSQQRYLILFQNNNELRATGGFIGSIAIFDVYQGKVNKLEIPRGGTYDLAYGQKINLKAPDALSLINHHFNIWDANWWYDFPTSAKKIIWFYQSGGGSSLDGTIAVNSHLLGELLQVVGPIRLMSDTYDLEINADNFSAVLQEEVELNYDKDINEPKGIIADLAPLVLEKILQSEDYRSLVSVLARSLSNKDVQLYLSEEKAQQKIESYGWAGAIENNNRDYLAVISTNIGGGKTDIDISQVIDHQAEIRPNGEIINTLRITRTNHGPEENIFAGIGGGNASYLRIYTPLGSQFIEARGFDSLPGNYFRGDPNARYDADVLREENKKVIDSSSGTEIYDSLDKTVFAHWMLLRPGESKTVLLKYKLPFKLDFSDPLVNNWLDKIFKKDLRLNNYSLLVQSQSGQKNTVLHSSVLLPEDSRVVFKNASKIDHLKIADLLVAYDSELERDQYFGFILAK